MFKKANIKLTLIYSSLFLIAFWAFSIGLYFWMGHSFGESYIGEIEQHGEFEFDEQDIAIANAAADVAQKQLQTTLIVINGAMLIIVPTIAWLMTRRALSPVQRIHEQQKQFVSDVAHELRTPLSIMSGELEVALRKERTLESYRQVLNSSKQEVGRLIELSENLLFLARADQVRHAIDFEQVDVTDLIGGAIADLQAESRKKEITIHFEPEEELTFVWGQSAMLRRLFLNLIDNAIQYTPSRGEIWISLSTGKQYTEVKVRDSGTGIAAEDQERIFDRFYRVDQSRSRTKGYGLGLAICKSIVELHHGTIAVRSDLGKGATFTVTLPHS
jgi:signal transduction histidine kinase